MGIFDGLWQLVEQMGEPLKIEDVKITFEARQAPPWIEELANGIEIDINDLDATNDHGGLLGYKGAQVLLFLQNQQRHFDRIESGHFSLPKYHVAECNTLREMRNRGEFERYVVTNDKSGIFRLDGPDGKTMEKELSICRNCLSHLNYRGYRTNASARTKIFDTFNLKAFFAIYSSLFSVIPGRIDQESFDVVRAIKSDEKGFAECTSCGAHLPVNGSLLGHVASGPKPDNVVCIDCQRKINIDTPQPVPRATMVDIASARRKKRPLSIAMSWDEVYAYADSAYAGLLRVYQSQGWTVPEPGVDITDENDAVCLQLGLVWLNEDGDGGEAVVLDEAEAFIAKNNGWQAMTLNEALLEARQDGGH